MIRRSRTRAFAIVVVAAVATSLSVLGTDALGARRHADRHGMPRAETNSRERFDLVGEGHPTGGLQAFFGRATFPRRSVIVEIPHPTSLSTGQFRVIEDGSQVASSSITPMETSPKSRYIIRYRSQRPSTDREVELSILVEDVGIIDLDYDASQVTPSKSSSFWASSVEMGSAAFAAGFLLVIGLIVVIVPQRRRSGLRRRVAEYTVNHEAESIEVVEAEPAARLSWLDGLLGRMSWWPKFKENVEIAGFSHSPAELVARFAIATIVAGMMIGLTTRTAAMSIVILPFGGLALHLVVRYRLLKRRRVFGEQLAGHLEELASAMRAGHGLVSGLSAVARSASEPSHTEWTRVLADEQLGMPLEEAMRMLAKRMDNDDVEQVALVASLHHRTGGNMAEVLDRVSEGVRERAELLRELRALTSQARLSRWVVTALPVGLVIVIDLIDPSYMRPLFHTTGGFVVLSISAVLVTIGSLIMQKMTNIKV